MIVQSIYVKSFGKLADFSYNFNSGINVIQDVNGFGKSTMASFIRAMLYGVKDGDSRKRFAPWQGEGTFGGSMVVLHNGNTFTIERYFGATARQDSLTVINTTTGNTVSMEEVSVGEYFLGLTSSSYDRSAYFPQEAVELQSNQNFDDKLANVVQDDTIDYDKVQKSLREYKKSFKYEKGNGGTIYQTQLQIEQVERQLSVVQANKRRYQEITQKLQDLENTQQQLQQQNKQLDVQIETLQSQVAGSNVNGATQQRILQLQTEVSQVDGSITQDQQTCSALHRQITSNSSLPLTKLAMPCLVLFVALLVAGIITLTHTVIGGALLIVFAVVSLFVGVVGLISKSNITDCSNKLYGLAGKYVNTTNKDTYQVVNELTELCSEYRTNCNELQSLVKQQDAGNLQVSQVAVKLQQAKDDKQQNQIKLNELFHEHGSLTAEQQSLNLDEVTLLDQRQQLEQQLDKQQHDFNIAEQTVELLKIAKQNLSNNYLPKLRSGVTQLLNDVTQGNYPVVINKEFAIQLSVNGQTHEMEYFSRGIREITLLCFRIALSQMLYNGNIPFIIIDDSFVNFDEENFLRATQLINSLSQSGQVIYLTCHKRLGKLQTQQSN